jgi:two-component system, OmpR family, sensor histidine kinase SaeS
VRHLPRVGSGALRVAILVGCVAGVGALVTLAVGLGVGMHAGDVAHLALLLLPAIAATVAAMLVAQPLLARAAIRQSLAGVAAIAALVGIVNLVVLTRSMFVSSHDATQVAVLLIYSLGAGLGAAWGLARAQTAAVERLARTAKRLGDGDLEARVGALGAGPELDALGRTLGEMANELRATLTRERALEARRRDLITAVSHDLRTPLGNLRAISEAIDDGLVEDPPTLHRYVGDIRRSVDTLVRLVDDLFELAQIDAGAIEAETERALLSDVVGSAVAGVEPQAGEKRIALSAHLDGSGAIACSPHLERVLLNLLQNAVGHTPEDGTVRIEARRAGERVELAVEDDGEGIAREELPRVFEPFWRGDRARSTPGSGLGLALAKRIVEALGGEISAESEPLRGACFLVTLPC